MGLGLGHDVLRGIDIIRQMEERFLRIEDVDVAGKAQRCVKLKLRKPRIYVRALYPTLGRLETAVSCQSSALDLEI